jgi:ParB/RepB/Spo0J family partition protein
MTVATAKPPGKPPDLVPNYYHELERLVTPADNPVYTPAMLADLIESMREHGQLVPGWVCPSPELEDGRLLVIEGNRRLAAARILGLPFWAFNLDRHVAEEERIRLTFQHNHSRRVMKRDEIAERAARYIEITGSTQAAAARLLGVSEPTLSRAFGEKRIPAGLRPRADLLGLSIRSLVAAMPAGLMEQAIAFAETPGPDGRKPTRDQVAAYLCRLRKDGRSRASKPRAVTLNQGGRIVTLAVGDGDNASTVVKDLNAIAAKLGKHGDVPPDGWPFLFQ